MRQRLGASGTMGVALGLLAALAALPGRAAVTARADLAVQPAAQPAAQLAQAQDGCQFVHGFGAMRELIGADVVGDCVEDQRTVQGGDAEQRTTRGLLVWDKQTNRVAFTDGYRTWIGGPHGLQQRLNSEQFDWEVAEAKQRAALLTRLARLRQLAPLDLVKAQLAAAQAGDDARLWQLYVVTAHRLRHDLPTWLIQRVTRLGTDGPPWLGRQADHVYDRALQPLLARAGSWVMERAAPAAASPRA
jgi:hypothetical protein